MREAVRDKGPAVFEKRMGQSSHLRHSLASFLIRMRTDPKTVQTLLRHSDVKLTFQFYTHAVSRDRMAAAGKRSQPFLAMLAAKAD